MGFLTTAGIFILVLFVLVLVHELGHYITARIFGIRTLEFGFGYPPKIRGFRLFSSEEIQAWEQRTGPRPGFWRRLGYRIVGDTELTVNWLPLGGFVRLLGEEDPSDPRSLAAKRPLVRLIVLSAGAFMNFILPIALFTLAYMIPQRAAVGGALVTSVQAGSPAAAAGVHPGDQIIRINGRGIQNAGDAGYNIRLNQGRWMTWTVVRRETFGSGIVASQTLELRVYARWAPPYFVDPSTSKRVREGPTGISVADRTNATRVESKPFWEAIPLGFRSTFDTLTLAKNQVISLIAQRTAPEVQGPVGIAQATGEVVRQAGWVALLQFAALLSLNLAIFNILPIPMLDGGRILFVLIEIARRGKRVAPEREALVHFIGFVILISAVVVISYFDIARIIRGDNVFR